jgi:hypothetical protein
MRSRPQPSPCEGVRETASLRTLGTANPETAILPVEDDIRSSLRCRRRIRGRALLTISSSPGSYGAQGSPYRLPRERVAAQAPSRARISSSSGRVCAGLIYRKPSISSSPGRYIVFSGKVGSIPLSSCPGTYTVLAGKPCRPAREGISSSPGKRIVLPGKTYRPPRENVSSSPGNRAAVFAAKLRFPRGD